MKKRLRKKQHIREFKIYGIQFSLKRNSKDDFDSFLDAFIEEAIESNGCCFGGGGKDDELNGFIELGRKDDSPNINLKNIMEWMNRRPDVCKYVFGNITDAWYGPFDENDLKII